MIDQYLDFSLRHSDDLALCFAAIAIGAGVIATVLRVCRRPPKSY